MKATIDFNEDLYRQLKVEAARRGRTIRELVEEGVRYVLDQPPRQEQQSGDAPAWFATLRKYAPNAATHDMAAVRANIARARSKGR